MIINSFWYGSPLTRLGNICIKSFLANGFDFHLWSYSNKITVPKGCVIRDASEILDSSLIFMSNTKSFAPFSDWFRFTLLHKHGGTWVDMDMVCLNPFSIESNTICEEQIGRIAMGIIDLEKGHPMAKNLIDAYENPSLQTDYDTDSRIKFKKSISHLPVKEQRKVAPWGFLGNDLLHLVRKRYEFNELNINDFYPVSYNDGKKIYTGEINFEEIKNAKCIHMWGELTRSIKPKVSDESIMKKLITLHL